MPDGGPGSRAPLQIPADVRDDRTAQLGVGATDAFARQRAYACAEGRLPGEVAREVVVRRLMFDEEQRPSPGRDRT